ncbi:MAG: cupin domain-containing protein [Proteobacteria bacterium]|nr:cupin domain-containing protein [Pseudomonadota bacterium]MCP4922090.1 cupin domain-containing protein [Pseudomonadota bacterium]
MLTGAERARLVTLFDGPLAPFVDGATVEVLREHHHGRPETDLLVVLDGRGRHWPNGPRRDVEAGDLVFDPNIMELSTQLLGQLYARTPMRLARLPVPRPCPVPIAELIADLMEAERDTWVRRGEDVTFSARSFLKEDSTIEGPRTGSSTPSSSCSSWTRTRAEGRPTACPPSRWSPPKG